MSGDDGAAAKSALISLGTQPLIAFKLFGENQGRRVRSASRGSYLVIVPEDWKRDENRSGPASAEPEPVALPGCRAHFFALRRHLAACIAFETCDGLRFEIESGEQKFELIGSRLPDANGEIGPLFGGQPPIIRAVNAAAWNNIGTIVVGNEGNTGQKWRTSLKPSRRSEEQHLPSVVADREGGWYFIRLYDVNDDLVESLDFRFLRGLTQITMPHLQPLPLSGGHQPLTVEFHHDADCFVKPMGGSPGALTVI